MTKSKISGGLFIYLIICFLTITLAFISFKQKKQLRIYESGYLNEQNEWKNHNIKIKTYLFEDENRKLDDGLVVKMISTRSDTLLKDILTDKYKLVCRFKRNDCNVCIDSLLAYISDFEKKYGSSEVLLAVDDGSPRSFLINSRDYGIRSELIEIDRNKMDLQHESNTPYLFLINSKMEVQMVHELDKSFPLITKKYLSIVGKRYFETN